LKSFVGGSHPRDVLTAAVERSSPSTARLLAELFGGLDISMELGEGAQVFELGQIVFFSKHFYKIGNLWPMHVSFCNRV